MRFDKTLILAAGKGTRMGEIGKYLPKVLWPIFEKTILELEIEYARFLGSSNIYINSHYYTKELKQFFESRNYPADTKLIIEQDPIDIGGAIHNIANIFERSGNLLIVNSDQFLMLDEKTLKLAEEKLKLGHGVLFVTTVNSNERYNRVNIDKDGVFTGVTLNSELKPDSLHETYIGISIINLSQLEKSTGKSKFFESVANPDKTTFYCINVDHCNYWDFGTTEQYYENMFKLLVERDNFTEFLFMRNALLKEKISSTSYNSKVPNTINLSKFNAPTISTGTILLDGPGVELEKKALVYQDIIQPLC